MKSSTLSFRSAASLLLLLLGVQLGAAQTPFSTSGAISTKYGTFPRSNLQGFDPTCSETFYNAQYPVAVTTFKPTSDGTYQIRVKLSEDEGMVVYLYSSNPSTNTTKGCVNQYGTESTDFSFDEVLTAGTTYFYVFLTFSAQSGSYTLGPANVTTVVPATTATPSTTPAATTNSPSFTPAPTTPATTTEPATTPPDTIVPATTASDTTAPATTAPATTAPDTTVPATKIPGTTQASPTASPVVSKLVPQTSAALASSQPLASSTPAVTLGPAITAVAPSTPAPATSSPLASTTPPTPTGAVTVTLTVDFTPNPPLAGQLLTIFGDAVASSGPAPTGNVTVSVDGVPVAIVPVIPDIGGGRRQMLQSARSVYTVTITAPSTPGVHVITVVFFPTVGTAIIPVAAPVTVDVNIPPANATVSLALSSSTLLFPFCTKPLEAVATLSGTTGLPQPTGTVTLALLGDNYAAIGAQPINAVIGTAPLIASAASFELQAVDPITSIAEAVHGESASTKLLPGSYQLKASYSGDASYGPASGSTTLTVGPKCSLSSLALSDPKA